VLCGSMPFEIDVQSLRPERHKQAVSSVKKSNTWRENISDEGKNVVQSLLRVDPDQRLSASDCSKHVWFDTLEHEEDRDMHEDPRPEQAPPSPTTAIVGVVRKIAGRTGQGVECLELTLSDGSVKCFGGDGHCPTQSTWSLDPDELLTAVMQEPLESGMQESNEFAGLGNCLVFYTSARRAIVLEGEEARHRLRFLAPVGMQVIGLNFDRDKMTGVLLEMVGEKGNGAVRCISGKASSSVHEVSFELRNGLNLSYGNVAGRDPCRNSDLQSRGPWELETNEVLIAVEQSVRGHGLGGTIVFYTSTGRVIKISGLASIRCPRLAAPPRAQLSGFEFDEGGKLAAVSVCDQAGTRKMMQRVHDSGLMAVYGSDDPARS